jgi:hypothetical protein
MVPGDAGDADENAGTVISWRQIFEMDWLLLRIHDWEEELEGDVRCLQGLDGINAPAEPWLQ